MKVRHVLGAALAAGMFAAPLASAAIPASADVPAPWGLGAAADSGTAPELHGVSCVSATFCVAVGTTAAGAGASDTLVEQWDGTQWSTVPSDDGGVANELDAVSCVSETWCVAVGWAGSGGRTQPLVETYDGTFWVARRSLTVASSGVLAGVSCTTSTSCMAVGAETVPGKFSPAIALQWDGALWTRLALPAKGTRSNSLGAISCPTSTQCVAVGSWGPRGPRRPLAEVWNAGTWTLLADAYHDTVDDALTSVSCPIASNCVALGTGKFAFAQQFTGSAPRTKRMPSTGATATFDAVSCTATTACTAVGFVGSPAAPNAPALVATWDGSAWSSVSVPAGSNADHLLAVSCATGAGCVGAGTRIDAQGHHSTLAESNVAAMQTTVVTVTLSSEELGRLVAVAGEFGLSPQAFLNNAVNAVAYLVGVLPSDPSPVTLDPAGNAATYVVMFDANTVVGLQSIEQHFVLAPADAVRFATLLTAYLVITGGG